MSKATQITHGPFTWVQTAKDEGGRGEVWDVQIDRDLPVTHWCVKHYSDKMESGFNGWKLVSGGPFDSAGCYVSSIDAIKGVTPWLVNYYLEQIAEALVKADALRAAAVRLQTSLLEVTV